MRKERFVEAKMVYVFMCSVCMILCMLLAIVVAAVISYWLSPDKFDATICFGSSVIGTITFYEAAKLLFKYEVPMKMAVDVLPGAGYDIHIIRDRRRGYFTDKWEIKEDEDGFYLEVCGARIPLKKNEYDELSFFNSFKKKSYINLSKEQYFALLKDKKSKYKKHIEANNQGKKEVLWKK